MNVLLFMGLLAWLRTLHNYHNHYSHVLKEYCEPTEHQSPSSFQIAEFQAVLESETIPRKI
jgi:hypothetical protein